MKINYGQILFMVLALLIAGAAMKFLTQKEKPYIDYMIVTEQEGIEYIHTQETLFLKDTSGCITNGKENIRCGVKHLTLLNNE